MPSSQVEMPTQRVDSASPVAAEIPVRREARFAALVFLARRDYSRLELYQKLIAKGFQSEVTNDTLDDLQRDGSQSDERFAEIFIRSRINAGDGPFKIKIALRGKGICDSLTLSIIDRMNIDWFERIQVSQQKRFGQKPPENVHEMARQIRYLKNKGFCQEHINTVVSCPHETSF